MKYEHLKRSLLAKQLLAENQSNPEEVIEKLLSDLASLKREMEELHCVLQTQPVPQNNHKSMLLTQAITSASLRMHAVFHRCHVPNAILTTIQFPDGLYKLTFQRLPRKSDDIN